MIIRTLAGIRTSHPRQLLPAALQDLTKQRELFRSRVCRRLFVSFLTAGPGVRCLRRSSAEGARGGGHVLSAARVTRVQCMYILRIVTPLSPVPYLCLTRILPVCANGRCMFLSFASAQYLSEQLRSFHSPVLLFNTHDKYSSPRILHSGTTCSWHSLVFLLRNASRPSSVGLGVLAYSAIRAVGLPLSMSCPLALSTSAEPQTVSA